MALLCFQRPARRQGRVGRPAIHVMSGASLLRDVGFNKAISHREGQGACQIQCGLLFLICKKRIHKLLINKFQLLFTVQSRELFLSVRFHYFQNDKAIFLIQIDVFYRLIAVLPLHGREESHIGLAVVLQCVQMLQFEFVSVLVGDGDKIRTKFFAHGCHRTFLFLQSYFTPPYEKKQDGDVPNFPEPALLNHKLEKFRVDNLRNHVIMANSRTVPNFVCADWWDGFSHPAVYFGGVLLASTSGKKRRRSEALPLRVTFTVLKVIGTLALVGVLTCAILACFATVYVKTVILPDAHLEVGDYSTDLASTMVYIDKNTGQEVELVSLHGAENRVWVTYDQIPENLINAAVAIEDKEFWNHHGVNWRRTIKGVINMFTGQDIQGGSTITQQLIKNMTDYDDVTVKRKILEIFRALDFDKTHDKRTTMEMYLNYIYLGKGCYGVSTAAQTYFGKELSELSLAECASLIAITNNPSIYGPNSTLRITDEETGEVKTARDFNKERQELILSEMKKEGMISEEEYQAAVAEELVFATGVSESAPSTIFSWYEEQVISDVMDDLREQFGYSDNVIQDLIYRGGVKIYACVDPEIQAIVEEVYENRENLQLISASGQEIESAIVIIDPNGDVVGLAGGMGDKEGNRLWNYASDTVRQPGSSIKPLSVYAPAIEMGLITPYSIFDDSAVRVEGGKAWPSNSYGYNAGRMTVYDALRVSSNPVALRVLQLVTPEASFEFMENRFHIDLEEGRESWGRQVTDKAEAPLSMGGLTDGVSVMDMAAAYSTFPRGGMYVEPRTYTKVVDAEGEIILDNTQRESEAALKETTAWYMNHMLKSVLTSTGTGRTAAGKLSVTAAGKTGSTDSNNDRWFVGYTPYYTAAVWAGYRNPERIVYNGGYSNPALDMWTLVMQRIHEGLEDKDFPQPDGLVTASYCMDSGMIPTEACSHDPRGSRAAKGYFFSGTQPTQYCEMHQEVEVCTASPITNADGTPIGNLYHKAGEYCPRETVGDVEPTVQTIALLNYEREPIAGEQTPNDAAYLIQYWEGQGLCDVHTEEIEAPPEVYDPAIFDIADPSTWPPPELYPYFDPDNPNTWPEYLPPAVTEPPVTEDPGLPETPVPTPSPTPTEEPVVPVEPILPDDGPDDNEPYIPVA